MVDALFTERIDAAQSDISRWGLAHALDDDGGVGLEDDAVVYDLIHGERHEVVALDDGALVDRGLEEQMKGVAKGEDGVVKQDLVLLDAANEVEHYIALRFVEHAACVHQSKCPVNMCTWKQDLHPAVEQQDVSSLFCGLLQECLLKGLL